MNTRKSKTSSHVCNKFGYVDIKERDTEDKTPSKKITKTILDTVKESTFKKKKKEGKKRMEKKRKSEKYTSVLFDATARANASNANYFVSRWTFLFAIMENMIFSPRHRK